MINLFNIPPADQSVYYLGQIFGYVGTVLPVSDPTLLLGTMFKVLNTMALTIGAFIVVYVTIVGMLATAHEGEFLGKKWSGLWVPIRTALGIAALFPTASGYSAIQILAMWIILQGIGAADTLWTAVLKYSAVMGSPYATVSAKSVDSSTLENQMQKLFQALVCQASAKADYDSVPVDGGSISYLCSAKSKDRNAEFCSKDSSGILDIGAQNNANTSYAMGPNGACGLLLYCDVNDPKYCNGNTASTAPGCLACLAQRKALQSIVSTLGAIAAKFVEVDHQYLQFYYSKQIQEQAQKQVSPFSTGQQAPAAAPEPAQWIKDFCSEKGISGKECIASAETFKSYKPVVDMLTNAVNVSPDTAEKLYLEYPLKAYLKDNNLITLAVSAYLASLLSTITDKMDQATLEGWQKDASNRGWITAGAYYYELSGLNKKNVNAAHLTFTMPLEKSEGQNFPTTPMVVSGVGPDIIQPAYRSNFNSVMTLTSASQKQSAQNFVNPAIGNALNNTGTALVASFTESVSDQKTVPIMSIAKFGYQMMITAQALFALILIIMVPAIALSNINFMVAGSGLTLPPWGEAVKALFSFLGPFFILLFVSLFTLGGMLGIYVPLIPFIIFAMGAVGWIMATIEAMVAAPFVALGILGPGGQHEILGRGEPAVMLIFNVFLRPSLMVFGLLAAMLASIPVIKLINAGFLQVSENIIGAPGLFEAILFIAAYTSLIVTAVNKIFSLIFIIPERVLTWIGGPAVQYGEGEALGAIKHGVEGAGGAAAGAGRETGGAAYGGAMGYAQSKAQEKESGGAMISTKGDVAQAKNAPKRTPETPAGPVGGTGAAAGATGATGTPPKAESKPKEGGST